MILTNSKGFDSAEPPHRKPQPSHETDISAPFLRPPLHPLSDTDVPYRADASDKTSLNQKKRHHAEHKCWRPNGYARRDDSPDKSADILLPERSRSLPCLRNVVEAHQRRLQGLAQQPEGNQEVIASGHDNPRRWTVPSKAASTQELTIASSICRTNRVARRKHQSTSPAVVTLRHAKSYGQPETGITFFPAPNFRRAETGFLSVLLNKVNGETPNSDNTNGIQVAAHQRHRCNPPNSSTVLQAAVHGGSASPALTKATVTPVISMDTSSMQVHPRRCSTQYISRTSLYEIIWDANDTPSSDSTLTQEHDESLDQRTRRKSMAMSQLEVQLTKAVAQSRRESMMSQNKSLAEILPQPARRLSLQDALTLAFSRLLNESMLRDLPRSKASTSSSILTSSVIPQHSTPQALNEETLPRDQLNQTDIFHEFDLNKASKSTAHGHGKRDGKGRDDVVQTIDSQAESVMGSGSQNGRGFPSWNQNRSDLSSDVLPEEVERLYSDEAENQTGEEVMPLLPKFKRLR